MFKALLTLLVVSTSAHAFDQNPHRSIVSASSRIVVQRTGALDVAGGPPCIVTLLEHGQGYILRFESKHAYAEFYDLYSKNPSARPNMVTDIISVTTVDPIGAKATFNGEVPTGRYRDDYRNSKASLELGAQMATLRVSSTTPGQAFSNGRKCIFWGNGRSTTCTTVMGFRRCN